MKLKLVIFFIICFSVPMVSEEWEIEVTDNNVLVSIPGNIMHGDKYRIILVPENRESCDIANLSTWTFYLTGMHTHIQSLKQLQS